MKNNIVRQITLIAMFIVILIVCSYISIPMSIPFTLQTFAVFACLLILGGRNGTIAISIYILMGILGLPVFSGFSGGISVVLGLTGGYILGFLSIGLIYWLFEVIFKDNHIFKVISLIIGLLSCYVFGTLWFSYVYMNTYNEAKTFISILSICVFPYIIPDLIKLALAIFISSRVKKIMNKEKSD